MFQDNSVKICKFCGDITSGVLCPRHKLAENRKEDIKKQLALEEERGTKTDRLFMFRRKDLLEHYKIKDSNAKLIF